MSQNAKRAEDIIAIDGPAGSGKSTVARLVAKALGYLYIDTGAMYRALTLKALEDKLNFKDEPVLTCLARNLKIQLKEGRNGSSKVFLDGRDVTMRIRGPQVNAHISALSRLKEVRKEMVSKQRLWGRNGRVILEGRDIGTVVFPRAGYKFYLDAQFRARVERRYREFASQDRRLSWSEVRSDLLRRDRSDRLRKIAPLKKALDAVYIDTTNLAVDEVVEVILSYIRSKAPVYRINKLQKISKFQ